MSAEDKIVEWMDKVEEVLANHGDEAVNAGLTAIQLHGFFVAGSVLIGLLVSGGLGYLSYRLFHAGSSDSEIYSFLAGLVSFAIICFTALGAMSNYAAWIAIFDPKLALAYRAVESLL